VLLKHFVRTTV